MDWSRRVIDLLVRLVGWGVPAITRRVIVVADFAASRKRLSLTRAAPGATIFSLGRREIRWGQRSWRLFYGVWPWGYRRAAQMGWIVLAFGDGLEWLSSASAIFRRVANRRTRRIVNQASVRQGAITGHEGGGNDDCSCLGMAPDRIMGMGGTTSDEGEIYA